MKRKKKKCKHDWYWLAGLEVPTPDTYFKYCCCLCGKAKK